MPIIKKLYFDINSIQMKKNESGWRIKNSDLFYSFLHIMIVNAINFFFFWRRGGGGGGGLDEYSNTKKK